MRFNSSHRQFHSHRHVCRHEFQCIQRCPALQFKGNLPAPSETRGEGDAPNAMFASILSHDVRWLTIGQEVETDALVGML